MHCLRCLAFTLAFAMLAACAAAGQDKPKAKPGTAKQKPKPPPPALAELLKAGPDEFLKRFDMNRDGLLSKEELPPRLAEAFDRIDSNKDGKLDQQEVSTLLAVLRKQLGQPPAPDPAQLDQVVRKFLERADTNKDGQISKDEAVGPLAQRFAELDANKDGKLDQRELRKFAAEFLGPKAGKPRPFGPGPGVPIPDFDAFDANADGRLTPEEVKQAPFADRFTPIDTNKDGRLDRKEFEAYFLKQPAKPPKKGM